MTEILCNFVFSHVGDFGNVMTDAYGNVHTAFSGRMTSLSGMYSVVGRALVVSTSSVGDVHRI